MALNSSGVIKFSDINTELGLAYNTPRKLSDTAVRTLFGVASGRIALRDGYGKADPLAVNYVTFSSSSGQSFSKTYNDIAIGTPHPRRRVYLVVTYSMTSSGNNAITLGTIGEIAVTVIGPTYGSGSTLGICTSIVYADVPTGATATVVLNFAKNLNAGGASIYVYRVINQVNASLVDSAQYTSVGGTVFSATVSTAAGGFCLGSMQRSTQIFTYTSLTGLSASRGISPGYSNTGFALTAAGTPLTATWTLGASYNYTATTGLWSFSP
jgi:hypothetical protein